MTIGNLRGFEHQFALKSATNDGYSARVHEDVVRFEFYYGSAPNVGMPSLPVATAVKLGNRPSSGPIAGWPEEWQRVAQSAMATGAFPVGLLPRDVVRGWSLCEPRILVMKPGQGGSVAVLPVIHGPNPSSAYSCLSVDGGVFNNEPFELARTALSGLLGSNERDGTKAARAVIMVDPLVKPSEDDFEHLRPDDSLFRLLSGLVMRGMVDQGRTHLPEWTSAMSDDIYSRYLLAPSKGDSSGEDALCGSALGAFGGFLCEAYREHDFRLGRRNCQRFLQQHFVLPSGNPLFKGNPKVPPPAGTPPGFLPIIPLMGSAQVTQPEPDWPSHDAFSKVQERIYSLLEQRLDAIYQHLVARQSWIVRCYLGIGWKFARPGLLKSMHESIEKNLRKKGLY